jgi:curved DNA-binding protein CbpA
MGEDEPNPYAVLQVDPSADHEVVRAAYRALARIHHPDVGHDDARRVMVALNRAWELLGDPTRRREVDRQLRARGVVSGAGQAASGANGTNHRHDHGGTAEAGGSSARREPEWPTPLWMQRNSRRRVTNDWGAGTAGPPPGRPSGSVIDFGVYKGWSLGEVARFDSGYLTWLADRPEGRPFAAEIAAMRAAGRPSRSSGRRRGFFRRG